MSNLKIFALGGLHEVGKNCYCIEKSEDLIIVDYGVLFINNNNLADGAIPDFTYLQENSQKIKGLFITHAHEDHIGGIPYLLQFLPPIPIYGSEFSISYLKQKLGVRNKNRLIIFSDDTIIRTNEFRISFFRVTHSIPGSFGLIVEVIADQSRLVLTGDFKFDWWKETGEKTDLAKLAEVGKKGVDLLLSESTNAEIEGNTPSEIRVIKRLESIITEASGRVIITSFASNVYRLKKVIEIAQKTQKKIALLVFLPAASISKIRKNKLIIFCTGSQGEEKAVLSLEPGDTIILTSSPIMDNRLNVEIVSNKLFALGAQIYENSKEDLLHASGHACQEDLKLMLKLVNPTYLMPIHGDFRMLKNHGYLAEELGVAATNVFVCANGEVVEAREKKFFLSGEKIAATPHYIFDKKLVPAKEMNNSLKLRERMARGGVVLIVIFRPPGEEKLTELPYIFTYGFINMEKNQETIKNYTEDQLLKD
ncbi:10872_t:CDS:2 [Racocetra fulgida]|uniref:10872_t:CDS:1 n=1 Tax=Racocetra fulgida TaxID=60492 RepID=A0A9N8VLX9_9GLOM|nr:10872_t:CDS:2 [Racocetra fulgida]